MNTSKIPGAEKYRILYGEEIVYTDIKAMLNVCKLSYDGCAPSLDACLDCHQKNPYIYMIAMDITGTVVGYMSIFPIPRNIYDSIKEGNHIDSEITLADILEYKPGCSYDIYLSSICVHPEYRNRGVATLLLKYMEEKINELHKQDIQIRNIIADALTTDSQRLLSNAGFKAIATTGYYTTIMEKTYES